MQDQFPFCVNQSSFPVLHKVGKLTFLYCFNFGNYIEIVVTHLNFSLKHHENYKFAVILILLVVTSNSIPLEGIQKCQNCQLCVLRGNSNAGAIVHLNFRFRTGYCK